MTLSMCANCDRIIDLFELPGGSPMVEASPEKCTTHYAKCDRCGVLYCGKCVESNKGKCPDCGRRVELQGQR